MLVRFLGMTMKVEKHIPNGPIYVYPPATVNRHPLVHHEGWMIHGLNTVVFQFLS
jgi:hypothetical protein